MHRLLGEVVRALGDGSAQICAEWPDSFVWVLRSRRGAVSTGGESSKGGGMNGELEWLPSHDGLPLRPFDTGHKIDAAETRTKHRAARVDAMKALFAPIEGDERTK
jgi:hypothetical protein